MKKLFYLLLLTSFVGFNSCSDDDDVKLPDITVNFVVTEIGIDETNSSQDVLLNLSRKSDAAIDVTVLLTANGVEYGTDFNTNPIASENTLKVNIPAGETSASFKVSKADGALFDGTETVKFEISAISIIDGVKIGSKKTASLTFGTILSEGSLMTLEGKTSTSNYANSVYVDFSSNTQTAVDRKSWDLGFYTGSEFKVILNGAYATTATASTKTDINAVTIDDAEAAINIASSPMTQDGLSTEVIDSYDGALNGTVFAEISANDADNKVYFVASEGNKTTRDQWYKVKVNRKGDGYTVQYAKVSETTIKTIDISKNSAYNFTFLSLEKGETANVEPQAKKWDIMWSYYVGNTGGRPYFMQDMVLTNNIGGVETVEVLTSTVKYENFTRADITGLEFSENKNVIASNWRVTANMGGATGSIGVKKDRFYVIKDANGNYYKLRFTKIGLSSDGGERGRPQIEYQLIK